MMLYELLIVPSIKANINMSKKRDYHTATKEGQTYRCTKQPTSSHSAKCGLLNCNKNFSFALPFRTSLFVYTPLGIFRANLRTWCDLFITLSAHPDPSKDNTQNEFYVPCSFEAFRNTLHQERCRIEIRQWYSP